MARLRLGAVDKSILASFDAVEKIRRGQPLTDISRSGVGSAANDVSRGGALRLRTLRGLQRLGVKFEAAESILAYRFVGGRIEEINKHEFFRVSCKII